MPLSKARDRERKRQSRLDAKRSEPIVQPKRTIIIDNQAIAVPELDADGQVIYDD